MQLFHRGFFLERFRQIRTAGIVAAAVLVISNVSYFFLRLSDGYSSLIPEGPEMALGMMMYVYITGLVLTLSAYGWLNRRHTSDFYHALAIKRSAMYGSSTLAVLLWMTIGLVAYGIVQVLLNLAFRIPFNYLLFLCVWINMWIAAVQMIGAVSIACAISGTRFVNLFATAFILFVPRMLLMVFASFLSADAPRSVLVLKLSPFLNPSFNLLGTPYMSLLSLFGFYYYGDAVVVDYANVWAMLYSLCYGVLLHVFGCIAFVRRSSELAGVPMRSKLFQGAIRTAIGLPLLLIVVFLIKNDAVSAALFASLIVFSFVFYCLYELISTKQPKKMLLSMAFYPICIGIALLYLVIPWAIAKGFLDQKYDSSSIRGYSIRETEYNTGYSRYPTFADTQSLSIEIQDPEGIRIIADALNHAEDSSISYFTYKCKCTVQITGKNGKKELRQLYLTDSEWERLHDIAEADEQYTALETDYPKGTLYYSALALSQSEADEIGALFASEYASLSVSERASLQYNSYVVEETPRTRLTLTVLGCYRAKNYRNTYRINELTPKTAKRYLEILEAKNGEDVKRLLQTIISALEEGTDYLEFGMVVGESISLDSWSMVGKAKGDRIIYSKETDPEYYEIFSILARCDTTTDLSRSVMLSIDSYGVDYDFDALLSADLFTQYGTYRCGLAISDADYQRILTLLKIIDQKTEETYAYYDEKGM